jgi:hypothetical protein
MGAKSSDMNRRDMKKLFVSVGLAAAGVASVHAQYAPDAPPDNSKIWALSGTLRGFYDDNYTTTPQKQSSVGFEVSPSFSLNEALQQTEIGIRYTYGLYYYQKRQDDGQNPIDQTHQFDLWLDHAFTPRWEARVSDSVIVAQEPALLANGGNVSVPTRVEGNNIANYGTIKLNTDWTRLFSTTLTYNNTFYDYEQSTYTQTPAIPIFSPASVNPSLAGALNLVEQTLSLNLNWLAEPETTFFIGYQFGIVNYTGNQLIAYNQPFPYISPAIPLYSDSRDNYSHYGYVGATHTFTENLSGNITAGVQYTTYYNDPNSSSALGPYGSAALIYTYAQGSYAQIGVTESRNATDTVNINSNGQITQDQESTVVYGSINHAITPKLVGTAVANYQYSIYHDGPYDSQSANFVTTGLDLAYTFNQHLSADLGYDFSWYTTVVPGQDYTRNVIYLGVTASY